MSISPLRILRSVRAHGAALAAAVPMAAGAAALTACSRQGGEAAADRIVRIPAAYVGRSACVECHQNASDQWQGSHHDLAMDVATTETVLGDFNDATLEHFGVSSRMFRRDGKPMVETDGPDGLMHEYEVKYVFGVTPLQQYLVEFPGGRLQPLPLCWDTRPVEQGGQRWFHIYPNEAIPAGDELHWTGRVQNWNTMCAECHSTNLHKRYDLSTDSFATSWSEIDVSCEACHGPGSWHVAWAEAERDGRAQRADPSMGLDVQLGSGDNGAWLVDPTKPTAQRSEPRQSDMEIETCARCHSRRGDLTDEPGDGRPLLDSHRLALLDEGLYFADGQIEDEVYVLGSFLQSRMHAAGVTCTDCHDPHSARVYTKGNDLCAKCHRPSYFDIDTHHHHPGQRGDPGTNCMDCHMPTRTYMVVDDRYDHSFRVPRPDLSERLGTPNACNACHTDETAIWAAERVAEWYGPGRLADWRYGEALHAGREGARDAASQLERLAGDPTQPAIARATALELFARNPGETLADAVRAGATDPDGLVRMGAAEGALGLQPAERLELLRGLLTDPLLAVRAEAARVLAPAVTDQATAAIRTAFADAERDYIASQLAAAERPEAHINLGGFYTDRGRDADAEREYREALSLEPRCTPAAVNLADLMRMQGREDMCERVLRDALKITPRDGAARHALGLALVRSGRREEALVELGRAAEYAPGVARYAYVLGVAQDSTGQSEAALGTLRAAHDRFPRDRDILRALVDLCRRAGRTDEAAAFEARLELLRG